MFYFIFIDHLIKYLQEYGPLAVLLFQRTNEAVNQIEKEDGATDLNDLVFISLGSQTDFLNFMNRFVKFYEENAKVKDIASKKRLGHVFKRIIPTTKELKKFMKKGKQNSLVFIVVLKMMEHYYSEVINKGNKYSQCIELAERFYDGYCSSYDYSLVELTVDCNIIKFADTIELELEGMRNKK